MKAIIYETNRNGYYIKKERGYYKVINRKDYSYSALCLTLEDAQKELEKLTNAN